MIFEIALPFLALGCAAFLILAAIPKLRPFALSISLWCVAFAFCLIAAVLGLLLVSIGIAAFHDLFQRHSFSLPNVGHHSWIGWFLFSFVVVVTIAGATGITAVHGIITRRLTLALFRIYVAAVSFGVGILSCAFVLLVFNDHLFNMAFVIPATSFGLLLTSALSYACFKNASRFRGSYPQRFPIVTLEEFDWKGSDPP
jgi:hypothetical protein